MKKANGSLFRYRKIEGISLLFVSFVIILMSLSLYQNIEKDFISVNKAYAENKALNIGKSFNPEALSRLLISGGYLIDSTDAGVIANRLSSLSQQHSPANLGALNKKAFRIPALQAEESGGKELKEYADNSMQALGYGPEIEKMYMEPLPLSPVRTGNGPHSVTVTVQDRGRNKKEGVIIRLKYFFPNDAGEETDPAKTSFYAATGRDGKAVFSGLEEGVRFSVIPIKKGFEYGPGQGTVNHALDNDTEYSFTENPHLIKLFGTSTYNRLKNDNALTVRTPSEFTRTFILHLTLFLLSFWILHFYFTIRKKSTDELMLPLLMFLSGICIVMMYSIHEPLTDTMRGNEMAVGVVIGLIFCGLLSEINLVKFFNSDHFDPLSTFHSRFPRGSVYLLGAGLLAGLLLIFGSGPEGSGAKVNLRLGSFSFQPGEIIQLLVILFFASFFSRHTDLLANIPSGKSRWKVLFPVAASMSLLVSIYLLLGDMGPALVLCLSFIIIYSVARRDFSRLIIGVVSYVLLITTVSYFISNNNIVLGLITAGWLLGWLLYCHLNKHFFESAVAVVLLIAAFIFGENIPNVGQRLQDRNDIFLEKWDNTVYGGDQIAHGIWGLSSGGLLGQGMGLGTPRVIPAAHTDMILPSTGEELGWTGLLSVIVCLAVLLHRTLLIGRKAAHPFAFYLCAGIAAGTGIRFLIIACGSIGLIPLTGITVPFLSFGKVSMIINLIVFGAVLSISRLTGSDRQKQSVQTNYDNIIVASSLVYTVCSFILIAVLFYYQIIKPDRYLIKPAFTAARSGERLVSYNPRINLLMKELQPGEIYDRNNLPLACNSPETLLTMQAELLKAGIPQEQLEQQIKTNQKRLYPFGAHMLFWVGNYNTRTLWSDGEEAAGFLTEYRHLSDLRGFDTRPSEITISSPHYKPNRYLPPEEKDFSLITYDYTELIPLLKAGLRSPQVKNFNNIQRNITLTIDAELQTRLQLALEKQAEKGSDYRASIVILNAHTGETLCSANYPLPDESTLRMLRELSPGERRDRIAATRINGQLFTETDLGTAFATPPGSAAKVISALAAYRKLGPKADKTVFTVSPKEKIYRGEPTGTVTMEKAIVNSSNIYFIKQNNELELQEELSDLYLACGIRINGRGTPPFYNTLNEDEINKIRKDWQEKVYNKGKPGLKSEFSYLAWGQGKMDATPLSMARVASLIANQGVLPGTKYILTSSQPLRLTENPAFKLTDSESANLLKEHMKKQSHSLSKSTGVTLYGKTGSPQRVIPGNKRNFDGWYIFFTDSSRLGAPMAVAVRVEQGISSGKAIKMTAETVIPVLKELNYLKN